MTATPPGWVLAPADALCEKIQDGTHFSPKTQLREGPFPYITAKNVRPWGLDLADVTYLDEATHRPIYARSDVRKGDVLLVKDGVNAGDAAINTLDGEVSLLSSVCFLRPRPGLLAGYLRYYIQSPLGRRRLLGQLSGTAIRRVVLHRVRSLPILVAPEPVQRRIVAAIETHFSRLDAAVASLTRAKANVANARASVLKAAVEGRLVTPAGSTSAKSWLRTTIGDAADVTGGLTKNANRSSLPGRLPYLRVANVYANELRLTEVETIGVNQAELPRVRLKPGDVLIVEGNGSADQLGRVAVWTGVIDPCVHQNHLIKARPRPGTNSRWLLYWMMSPSGRTAIQAVASSTSGLHTLSISKVQALPVPLPPLSIQVEIVAELDRRMSVLDKTEREVDIGLARCERLRQAILKHAFEGRLVPAKHPVASAALQRAAPAETVR